MVLPRLVSETTTGAAGTSATPYTTLASGQVASQGAITYSYDDEGRLVQVQGTAHAMRNTYNAWGQRVVKAGQGVLVFAYDEAGHLLGEYAPDGTVQREYVWLGDTLVGLLSKQAPNAVLSVHTDHLGTPRAVSNGSTVLWRWEGDAFGDSQPNEQVAGKAQKLTLPLRFPGQFYDRETGLNYNYFRDYNSSTGRYLESDPLGLRGGLNPYAYVRSNPILRNDPQGLFDGDPAKWAPVAEPVADGVATVGSQIGISTLATVAVGVLLAALPSSTASPELDMVDPNRGPPSTKNECPPKKPDCHKASPWELKQAGITDEHAYKTSHGAVPNSRFDICKCRDGSIRIAKVGQCGKTSDFWD